MIEGHQRVTCIFVVGCNNIEIRTSEIKSQETFGVGFTSCCKGNAKKVIYTWLTKLPYFLGKTDIVFYDGNEGIRRILDGLYETTGKAIQIIQTEAKYESIVDDVYYWGEHGRWDCTWIQTELENKKT